MSEKINLYVVPCPHCGATVKIAIGDYAYQCQACKKLFGVRITSTLPAAAMPVQEVCAPVEQAPVQEACAPVEQAPVQEVCAPVEQAPVQEACAPVEQAPVQEACAPVEQAPIEEGNLQA